MASLIYPGDGGRITHSVTTDNKVSVSITAPLTTGDSTIMAFDGTETIIFYVQDGAAIKEDSDSPNMRYSDGTWSISNVSEEALAGAGIERVSYKVNITYGDSTSPSNMTGFLAPAVETSAIVDRLTLAMVEPPADGLTVALSDPIIYSVQPKNTYVRVPHPNVFTFSDVGGVTFDGSDIGLTVTINSVEVPGIYGLPGYNGLVPTASLSEGMEELILG